MNKKMKSEKIPKEKIEKGMKGLKKLMKMPENLDVFADMDETRDDSGGGS